MKVIGITLSIILMILVLILLFVRSPWGQDIIIDKATAYVSDKTGTRVGIQKLFITFSGNILLDGLYLEDESGDTLLYSGKLETGVAFIPLIMDGDIHVSSTNWEGLRAKVRRDSVSESFNFDFLINAFVDSDTTEVEQTETDTTDSSMPIIQLAPVSIRDIRVEYYDQVMGLNSNVSWEELFLQTKTLDLNEMFFEIDEFRFTDAKIDYLQYKPFPPTEEDTTEAAMPILILHQLNLSQIDLRYESQPDGMLAEVNLGEFQVKLPEADLGDQRILLESLLLKDSRIALEMEAMEPTAPEPETETQTTEPFSWPEWIVEVGDIDLENNNIIYKMAGQTSPEGVFDPDHIRLEDFRFLAHNIFLKDQEAGGTIDQLRFKERSGFGINEFGLALEVNEQQFELRNLLLQTDESRIDGSVIMKYAGLDELINQPENVSVNLDISAFQSNLSEALIFAPDLNQNPYFNDIIAKGLQAKAKVTGDLNTLNIDLFDIDYGRYTSLYLQNAIIRNPTDMDRLYVDIPDLGFQTTNGELSTLFQEMDLGLDLPEEMFLNASAQGTMQDLVADVKFESTDGNLFLTGKYQDQEVMIIEADGNVQELDLGKILEMPELSPISLNLQLAGKGNSPEDLRANLAVDFEQLEYNGFDYSDLDLRMVVEDGIANLATGMSDSDLDFDLQLTANLDSLNPEYKFILDVRLLQLQALGLTEESALGSFQVHGDAQGNPDDLVARLNIENGRFVLDGRTYPLGEVSLLANLDSSRSSLDIKSEFLTGDFYANGSLDQLTIAINNYIDELMGNEPGEPAQSISAQADFTFIPIPLIDQVLVSGLEEMDSLKFDFSFQSDSSLLQAHINLAELNYSGIEVDSFRLSADGIGNSLRFNTGFDRLLSGPLDMGQTGFLGNFTDGVLDVGFVSRKEGKTLMQIRTELNWQNDSLLITFDPDTLILNGQIWNVPDDHLVTYAPGVLNFENFEISQDEHSILVTNSLPEEGEKNHLGIVFEDFRLLTLTSFLNPENPLARGAINGKFVIENPFEATGLVADLSISSLNVMDIPLGTLSLEASSEGLSQYKFDLSLKEGEIDTDLYGSYTADAAGASLDLTLDLKSLQMSLLEAVSDSALINTQGFITGNARLKGTTQDPEYEGDFTFKEAGFLVSQLNSRFLLEDESISFDETGLFLDQFVVRDEDGNEFNIDGKIVTEDFTNPGLNLKLNANDFQVLNSTSEDNDMFYGDASIDMDMNITGTVNLPVIKTTLRLKDNSDITFIVPEDELDVVERTGVVLFVDQENPNDVLEKRQTDIDTQGVTGYEVNAILEIDPGAVFHVIVDQRSGDNLGLQGEANLNITMEPNGRISLTGEYEVVKGHYELSMFGLVNRRFELSEGSTITWRGDPMDAALDMRAIYEVKTSVMDLMQTQVSGSQENMTQYRQSLPFLVYLNVDGELLKPIITFGLDMPEQSRGALGGNVYSTVRTINQQEDELNRQVFSLLVLNQFYPVGGNDGASGGTVSMARSSVSQVLSNQLNNFSDRLFGDSGFSVDFGVDSYTDYQSGSAANRTDLNIAAQQRLFNDRLVVQVGSQVNVEGSDENVSQENALFGDVSLEYLLNEIGRWRLKAFRKNQFESVIDGQLIITGLALIFNREFNEFRELWKGTDENSEPEEQKNNQEKTEANGGVIAPATKDDE